MINVSEEQKVTELAQQLKKTGFAISMSDAMDKARSILGISQHQVNKQSEIQKNYAHRFDRKTPEKKEYDSQISDSSQILTISKDKIPTSVINSVTADFEKNNAKGIPLKKVSFEQMPREQMQNSSVYVDNELLGKDVSINELISQQNQSNSKIDLEKSMEKNVKENVDKNMEANEVLEIEDSKNFDSDTSPIISNFNTEDSIQEEIDNNEDNIIISQELEISKSVEKDTSEDLNSQNDEPDEQINAAEHLQISEPNENQNFSDESDASEDSDFNDETQKQNEKILLKNKNDVLDKSDTNLLAGPASEVTSVTDEAKNYHDDSEHLQDEILNSSVDVENSSDEPASTSVDVENSSDELASTSVDVENSSDEPEAAVEFSEIKHSEISPAASKQKDGGFVEDESVTISEEADKEFVVMTNDELGNDGVLESSEDTFIIHEKDVTGKTITDDEIEPQPEKSKDLIDNDLDADFELDRIDVPSSRNEQNQKTDDKTSPKIETEQNEEQSSIIEQEKPRATLTEQEKKMSNLSSIFNFGRKSQ